MYRERYSFRAIDRPDPDLIDRWADHPDARRTRNGVDVFLEYGVLHADESQALADGFDLVSRVSSYGYRSVGIALPGGEAAAERARVYGMTAVRVGELDEPDPWRCEPDDPEERRELADDEWVALWWECEDPDAEEIVDLDDLLETVEALREGDDRALYLGWLNRCRRPDAVEPPVPAGMDDLDDGLRTLARSMGVLDLAVAAGSWEPERAGSRTFADLRAGAEVAWRERRVQEAADRARDALVMMNGGIRVDPWRYLASEVTSKAPHYHRIGQVLACLRAIAAAEATMGEFTREVAQLRDLVPGKPNVARVCADVLSRAQESTYGV